MQRPPWLRRLSPVDGIASLLAVGALAGVIWSPKLSNAVARATGSIQPIQLTVDVRHLVAAESDLLLDSIRDEGGLNFVIRNQPAGRVRVLDVQEVTQKLVAVQPDGRVVSAENPNPSAVIHARFALEADAETGASGVVIGGTKLKIGVPVELEGRLYRLNGVVSGVSPS